MSGFWTNQFSKFYIAEKTATILLENDAQSTYSAHILIFLEIPLRLQGPISANGTGRVEIFYNGEWGTICDNGWDINDARVVCRQLGYLSAVRALQGRYVPDGTGKIWLNYVDCTGNEQNLANCSHGGWGRHNCRHQYDAGVQCSSDLNVTVKGCMQIIFLSRTYYLSYKHHEVMLK